MRTSATLRALIGPLELIHAQAGPRLLRLVRFGVFALWLFKLLIDPLWRLAQLPEELFRPVGLLAMGSGWMAGMITPVGLAVFWASTVLVLVLALTNRAFPLIASLAALLLTIYSSLVRSYGPAVHTDIPLLLAVYALVLFAWADTFQARRERSGEARTWCSVPLIATAAMLCLTYCLVGINRVLQSPASFTGSSMEIWAIDASLRAYYFDTNVGWHLPQWPVMVLFLRAGLPIVTLFEITAPLCLIWPHYRWVFIPTMLSFHLLSLVLMNIFFFDNMLMYLLLVDWSRRFPGLSVSLPRNASLSSRA